MTNQRQLFIVGAQRCGTTYLYRLLDEHPEVEMAKPARPEPKFFLKDDSEKDKEFYLKTYFQNHDAAILGEKSTSYIESKLAAERIATCFPDAIIIFLFRDPVIRAISNYWMSVNNLVEDQPIDVLLDESKESRTFRDLSVSPFRYLNRGKYVEYLDFYSEYFTEEQLRILIYENFVGDRASVSRLYDSLDIYDYQPPSLSSRINKGDYEEPGAPAEIIERLNEYFEPWNDDLQKRFGCDISHWGKTTALA